MIFRFLFICIFLFPYGLKAQNLSRAKAVIDSLSAPYMHGRGYTNDGDKIAAKFIRKHFKNAHLKTFNNSYSQSFKLNVNTFEGITILKIDGIKLETGTDYIVSSTSKSGKGIATIFNLDTMFFSDKKAQKKFLNKDLTEKIIVYRLTDEKRLFKCSQKVLQKLSTTKALLATTAKLTHRVASYQLPFSSFIILKNKLPDSAKSISFEVNVQLKNNYQTQNLIGFILGNAQPDSFLVFSAHYDHLGDMGEAYFPGANDNASGIAVLLELAYFYSENPSPYSIALMAFGAEEAGLIGSKYYTEHPLFLLSKIKFLINLDLFATGEKGLTAVNGSVFTTQFKKLKKANDKNNYLPVIKSRGKAANSDHYFFTEKGVPSFFFYLMGDWKHYHDTNDKTPVPLSKFKEAFLLIRDFSNSL